MSLLLIIDAPTSAPAWTRPLHPIGVTNRKTPPTYDAASSSYSGHAEQEGVKLSTGMLYYICRITFFTVHNMTKFRKIIGKLHDYVTFLVHFHTILRVI